MDNVAKNEPKRILATNTKIFCKNCGRRIHQIGRKHRAVKNGCSVGSWIHYPESFKNHQEWFCCFDGHGNMAEPLGEDS